MMIDIQSFYKLAKKKTKLLNIEWIKSCFSFDTVIHVENKNLKLFNF